MANEKTLPDVRVDTRGGTIILFRPLTEDGKNWIKENTDPDAQWYAGALAVEYRYASDLLEGMQKDGLIVKVD